MDEKGSSVLAADPSGMRQLMAPNCAEDPKRMERRATRVVYPAFELEGKNW